MREIKFRAWCARTKTLVQDVDIYMGKPKWGNVCYEDAPVMQYTGLKDKNGVEIYEGDICAHKYYLSPVVVEFKDGAFQSEDVSIFDSSIEVIGNIYENPELLEK